MDNVIDVNINIREAQEIILNIMGTKEIVKQINGLIKSEALKHYRPFEIIKTSYEEMQNIIFNSIIENEEVDDLTDKVVLKCIEKILLKLPEESTKVGTYAAVSSDQANELYTYTIKLIAFTISSIILENSTEIDI